MKHLLDAELDACLDAGEPELESARLRHLAGCDRCAARLAALRDQIRQTDGRLGLLDHELPRVDPDAVMRRAGRLERRRALALAAGVAGLLVAGAALAIPGSPLRQWITPGSREADSSPPTSLATAPAALPGPGVRFVPTGPVEVAFEATQDVGYVLVIRTDDPRLSVYAAEGSATFSVGTNRVQVGNRGSDATYEVRVPTSVRTLRVVIAGVTVLEMAEGRVTGPPGVESSALEHGYRIPFPSPR